VDWNDLRYLLAVHRRGSLASAAKELGVTKTTMSRRLAALEDALGARLLDRRPNGMALTAAGREAVAAAEEMASASASLEARIASATDAKPSGTVRLTAPQWLAARYIIPALPALKSEYADVDVQLVGTNEILNVAQDEADLALRNVRPQHASLVARKIGALGGCVYASQLYLERKGMPRAREALAGHELLLYEGLGGMPGFEWMRESPKGTTVAFRANGPEGLVSAATAGLGLAALPSLLGDVEPSLRRVDALGVGRCDLLLVFREQHRATPRIRVVADFIAGVMSANRAEIDPFVDVGS
jgi:DNA-binding transcriptional LysR family regulator